MWFMFRVIFGYGCVLGVLCFVFIFSFTSVRSIFFVVMNLYFMWYVVCLFVIWGFDCSFVCMCLFLCLYFVVWWSMKLMSVVISVSISVRRLKSSRGRGWLLLFVLCLDVCLENLCVWVFVLCEFLFGCMLWCVFGMLGGMLWGFVR